MKRLKAMSDSDDEEEDDDDKIREELKDLIDDNPIDENSDSESGNSNASTRHEKRKKRSEDEDELDDRLEDDDYDLLEENLGVKVQRRVSFEEFLLNFHINYLSNFEITETIQASQKSRRR